MAHFDPNSKAPLALEDRAHLVPHRDRLGELVQILDGEPVAGELGAIGEDAEIAETRDLLDADAYRKLMNMKKIEVAAFD